MMNNYIKALIDRFWKKELSKQEQQDLLSQLDAQEQSLQDTLASDFESDPTKESLHSDEAYRAYLTHIHQKMGITKSKAPIRKILWKWSVAATVVCALGWVVQQAIQQQQVQPQEEPALAHAVPDSTRIYNSGREEKTIKLADGSVAKLQPGSTITFAATYGDAQRDVHQEGEVQYDVVRDSLRPFRVYADGYSTTALGTSFVVNTLVEHYISIKLITGKVVVKSTAASRHNIHDQFLLPGEELRVCKDGRGVERHTFTKNLPEIPRVIPAVTPKPVKETPQPVLASLTFVDTPLPTVFQQIARSKQVLFDLDAVHINDLYFTGDFNETDELQQMLSIICGMNNLSYTFSDATTVKLLPLELEQKKNNTNISLN